MPVCGARVECRRQLAVSAIVPVARLVVSPGMVIEISLVVQGLSLVAPVEQRSALPMNDLEAMPVASSACQGNGPNHVDLTAHD